MRSRLQKNVRGMVFVCVILAIGFVPVAGLTPVMSQEKKFPTKPIEVIVPFGPGGSVDVGTRIFVESLSGELKVPVVVRNLSGAVGLLGATTFLKTTPDGYTLLASAGTAIISAVHLSKTPPFDPRKDLLPVGYIAETGVALSVSKTSPFKSMHDFIQFAKSNPGKLKGGYSPQGGESHVNVMNIISDTKIDIKTIPYAGSATLIPALLGGHLEWVATSVPTIIPFVKSGDVRVLVLTRSIPELPGVPTGPDIGIPSFSINLWMGFFALPQTPKVAYDRLVAAVKTASEDPEMAKKLANAGLNVTYKNPREFSKLIDDQWEIFYRVLKEAGLKKD